MKLSEAQLNALTLLVDNGGSILSSAIPDKTEKDIFGCNIAGLAVYKKLEKAGLLFFTIEEDEEFDWTPEVYITEEGVEAMKENS